MSGLLQFLVQTKETRNTKKCPQLSGIIKEYNNNEMMNKPWEKLLVSITKKAHFLDRLAGGISGSGTKARASMSLFRNSNYTETYPAGRVTLPVGSALYVGVSVEERDPDFVVVLEDCYATHSSNPDDPMQHALIQNK